MIFTSRKQLAALDGIGRLKARAARIDWSLDNLEIELKTLRKDLKLLEKEASQPSLFDPK